MSWQHFFRDINHLAVSAHLCCDKSLPREVPRLRSWILTNVSPALPGFATFDLNQPHWIDSKFDVIVCDPPFFNVSLHRLFTALRLLSHHDFQQPLLVSYLTRRTKSVLDAFDSFNLRPTDYFPKYATVEENERNRIEFFSNIDLEALVAR